MGVFINRILLLNIVLLFSCNGVSQKKETTNHEAFIPNPTLSIAYFASGCFWCVEAIFESVEGVEEAVSGYSGGQTKNPTYKSIGSGTTGHAEAVAVYYNPKRVDFETLVKVFFGSHNPTTVNGQHPDYGTQYRSIAFYQNEREKKVLENIFKKVQKNYTSKIATEIIKFKVFYEAEAYHQDFEKRNPTHPYVVAVSIPRLLKFKKQFPQVLKKASKNSH